MVNRGEAKVRVHVNVVLRSTMNTIVIVTLWFCLSWVTEERNPPQFRTQQEEIFHVFRWLRGNEEK